MKWWFKGDTCSSWNKVYFASRTHILPGIKDPIWKKSMIRGKVDGKRKRGRPKSKWVEQIKATIGIFLTRASSMAPHFWIHCCQTWKNLWTTPYKSKYVSKALNGRKHVDATYQDTDRHTIDLDTKFHFFRKKICIFFISNVFSIFLVILFRLKEK